MTQQENLAERATDLWGRQVDQWVDSVNLCQKQYETLANLWTNQVTEAQKEGQKFMKEWTDCMNKGQTDLWKAWQAHRQSLVLQERYADLKQAFYIAHMALVRHDHNYVVFRLDRRVDGQFRLRQGLAGQEGQAGGRHHDPVRDTAKQSLFHLF